MNFKNDCKKKCIQLHKYYEPCFNIMQYLLIYFEFFLYIPFSHLNFPSFDSNIVTKFQHVL